MRVELSLLTLSIFAKYVKQILSDACLVEQDELRFVLGDKLL